MTTDDDAIAEKLLALRVHGSNERYYHKWVGLNSRLDGFQGAVLRVSFRISTLGQTNERPTPTVIANCLKDSPSRSFCQRNAKTADTFITSSSSEFPNEEMHCGNI